METIGSKQLLISSKDINKSLVSAKLILLISTALKRGVNIEDIELYSKELAEYYNVDESFYMTCILSALNLVNNNDKFSKVIIKKDLLNIREPQHFSKWIIWNGEDEFVRKRWYFNFK